MYEFGREEGEWGVGGWSVECGGESVECEGESVEGKREHTQTQPSLLCAQLKKCLWPVLVQDSPKLYNIASGSLIPRVEGGSGDETTPVVTGDDLM